MSLRGSERAMAIHLFSDNYIYGQQRGFNSSLLTTNS